MPKPKQRSRSLRIVKKRTPGGRLATRYEKRRPKQVTCKNCRRRLMGVAREFPFVMRNLPKSMKTVARPYGGNLCSGCSRDLFKERARSVKI